MRRTAPWLLMVLAAAVSGQEEETTILGRSSADHLRFEPVAESVDLPAGSRLRLRPHVSAPLLEVLPYELSLSVLDRSGDWVRVRVGSWQGWVLAAGGDTGPLSSGGLGSGADTVRLDTVHDILGERLKESFLGPFALVSDVPPGDLLERLSRVVGNLREAYETRFGVDPGPPGDEIVVLFADESDYRRFEDGNPRIAGLGTLGHTAQVLLDSVEGSEIRTMTATFVGQHSPAAVEEILVHELTHLLSRRAWNGAIPPWLEEGMAEDLALSAVDDEGRLELGSWGGANDVRSYFLAGGSGGVRRRRSGSRAALAAVLAGWRDPSRTDLGTLTHLPWRALVDPGQRKSLYAESAMLVRFLLDGPDPVTRSRFLEHLGELAVGSAESDLWAALERRPDDVEEDLYLWLRQRTAAFGMRVP